MTSEKHPYRNQTWQRGNDAARPLDIQTAGRDQGPQATVAAGIEVSRVEIDKDGKIVVIIGKPDAPHDVREIVL
jgi:hypothetical protein